jgi:hypothetical protein
MTQPWPDSENVDGEPVDVLGIDGPFHRGRPGDDPLAPVPTAPDDGPDAPPSAASADNE